MYWIQVISNLINVDINTARAIYEKLNWFDFSESSKEEIIRESKRVLLFMKS
jgi:hypothetical protein